MKYGNLTWGQTEALINKLGGEDVVRGILADRMHFEITEKSVLVPLDPVTAGPVDSFNPHEFFKTREGLWVSDQAKDLFLSVASDKVSLYEEIILQPFTLTEPANDATIRENLPEDHVFCTDELCAVLKYAIEAQWGGKSGVLDEKDYNWNIFYVKGKDDRVFVARVHWRAGRRQWLVYAWELVDNTWDAEDRVFSRNC